MQASHGHPKAIRSKREWRGQFTQARAARSESARNAADQALTTHVSRLRAVAEPSATIAAYAPLGNEPGSWELLDALGAAGAQVLLPVVPSGPPAPLQWVVYRGREEMEPGRFRIPEPRGSRLAPAAIAEAGMVLVPALATDHRGVRLGRGAGYYDRTLPMSSGLLVTLLYDDELVPGPLPMDEHDVPVHAALTPAQGLVRLPIGNSAE